jgi:CrcB protein
MGHLDRQELAAIFAGGAIGAVLRVSLARHFAQAPADWPWTIFIINITGSFALGTSPPACRSVCGSPPTAVRCSAPGCAAPTPFSTMQVELVNMVEAHRYGLAAGYAFASVGAGLRAIWLSTTGCLRATASPKAQSHDRLWSMRSAVFYSGSALHCWAARSECTYERGLSEAHHLFR